MPGATADDLRDALQGLSDKLDDLINTLPAGSGNRALLEHSQTVIDNAANDVDAVWIEAQLTNNNDLQTLKDLTAKINANAAAIAASEANTTKIVSIGTAALKLGTLLTAGGAVASIVSAATSLIGLFS